MSDKYKDEMDAICTRIRERYGVPLKNGRKYPVARNWQSTVKKFHDLCDEHGFDFAVFTP